jgi:hypothetical protein
VHHADVARVEPPVVAHVRSSRSPRRRGHAPRSTISTTVEPYAATGARVHGRVSFLVSYMAPTFGNSTEPQSPGDAEREAAARGLGLAEE